MTYIIIGNGFAGIRAIEGIREVDKKGEIILISNEQNYSRPLISYYLGKRVRSSAMPYRNDEFFETQKVTMKIGKKVSKIDVKKKTVTIADSETLKYDKLLIATGGTPIMPPIKGSDASGVFNFVTYADAQNIESYITEHGVKTAVVLGGGLIGLKATEAMMDLGIQVSVIELADRILSATFDRKASKIIEKALQEENCDVITEDTIGEIKAQNGKVSGVILKSGQEIDAEIVIVAIGVRPTSDLAKDTTIKVNRGIVVNDKLETSVKGVYAAGDVAEVGGWVIAILPLAARQGMIAGHNMAIKKGEKPLIYEGSIPMNSVTLANIPTISVGLTAPKEDIEQYEIMEKYQPRKNIYKKIILLEDNIVGAIFINEIDRAGIFTGLIQDKVDVSGFRDQLLKGNFGLISLPHDYRKHMVKEGTGTFEG